MVQQIDLIKRWFGRTFIERIEHMSVLRTIVENGRLSGHFAFMSLLSGAIAVLGLLLSSPAVVIGAMLLSPLMGPIMALGFALCILDLRLFKMSLTSLSVGIALAMGISYSIVFFSPITDATPEILSRTQPNLFDLLVAIFSGLAGGYAAIKRKGEAIVGVAIATALMPPLTVIGYGLATEQWVVTKGASLLFMTNLLAIALSVTILAKWYGFGARHSPQHTIWQTALIIGVFGALSLPLGVALKNIAYKGYITKTAQTMLNTRASEEGARVGQLTIAFPEGKPVLIRTTLLTKRYLPDADKKLEQEIAQKVGGAIKVELDQLIVARAEEVKNEQQIVLETNPLAAPANNILAAAAPTAPPGVATPSTIDTAIVSYARESLELPVKAQQIDEKEKKVTLVIGREYAMLTKNRRSVEKKFSEKFPGWTTKLISETSEKETSKLEKTPSAGQ